MTKKILIIGGGFAGLQTAVELQKKHLHNATITLISPKDYFEYYPGFYRMLTGVSPVEIAIPFSRILNESISVVNDKIISINPGAFTATGEHGAVYGYDYIVIAPGSEPVVCTVPGVCEYAYSFRSVPHVLKIRTRIHELVRELADGERDLVSIMIVGGGATGIEAAGSISVDVDMLARRYSLNRSRITIDIIHGGEHLMQQIAPKLGMQLERYLAKIGVRVHLKTALTAQTYNTVTTTTGTSQADIVIWTAGASPSSLLTNISGVVFGQRGRVKVGSYLEMPDAPHAFILGDSADTPYAGLAQTAFYDGAYVAGVIAGKLQNKTPKKYIPKQNAFILPIGKYWALFSQKNISMTGIFPYIARLIADVLYFKNLMGWCNTYQIFREGRKYRVSDCVYTEEVQ